MSKYTIVKDSAADAIIDQEISLIVNHLQKFLNGWIEAILLTGGFGRGEGGIVRENGDYRPINDYDIIVVIKKWAAIPQDIRLALPEFEKELNKQVSVKQIDLVFTEAWKLSVPSPSIGRYEIKNGYKLLYGKQPPKIRCFPPHFIPLWEGTKYFRNRGGGLLVAKLLLNEGGPFTDQQRLELIALEINKAVLAMGDACLIEHHQYHYSYVERKKRFTENQRKFNVPQVLTTLYMRAIDEKLNPNFSRLNLGNLSCEWQKITGMFIDLFLKFESKRLKKAFTDLAEYQRYTLNKESRLWRVIEKLLPFCKGEDLPLVVRSRLVTMNLLYTILKGDQSVLEQVASLLNRQPQDGDFLEKWDKLTKAFLSQWHPNGIITELIGVNCVDESINGNLQDDK